MILAINLTPIAEYRVIRIKGSAHPDSMNTYQFEGTNDTLKHRYGDGAEKLAIKMLKHIERKKKKRG